MKTSLLFLVGAAIAGLLAYWLAMHAVPAGLGGYALLSLGDLEAAKQLAKKSNLLIMAKRTSSGAVQTYRVFRATLPKPTFVGERINERSLLDLVRKLVS